MAEAQPVADKPSLDEVLGPFFMKKKKTKKGGASASTPGPAKPAAGEAGAAATAAASDDALRALMPPGSRATWKRRAGLCRGLEDIGRHGPWAVQFREDLGLRRARDPWVPPRNMKDGVRARGESECGTSDSPPEEGRQSSCKGSSSSSGERSRGSRSAEWAIPPEYLLLRLDPTTAAFLRRRWVTLGKARLDKSQMCSGAKTKTKATSIVAMMKAGCQAQSVCLQGQLAMIPEAEGS